jgi:carbon-monoxide dehydrogenase medium subunit
VFPSQFAYHRPGSVDEAVQLLKQNPDAKVLAGGHSLLPAMKLRLAAPSALVDLGRIDGLRGILFTDRGGNAVIGAMTTYQQLIDSADLRASLPIIGETAYGVGDPQVQARGTLGGSLAHADPAADFTAVVLALGGQVTAVGSGGSRTIGADDLFVDLLTTSLQPDEIITEIRLPAISPAQPARTGMAYEKFRHPASGYAVVGVAAVVSLGDGDTCQSARIAVTGATAKATRATAAEQALTGKPLSAETIAAAAGVAAQGLDVNGDHYASADYRRHLVGVYARRAIERAAAQARG